MSQQSMTAVKKISLTTVVCRKIAKNIFLQYWDLKNFEMILFGDN